MSNLSKEYIAIIHKENCSDYGVSFPDFPGCITAGKTLEEAKDLAEEVLQFHVDGLLKDGDFLPERSTLDKIKKENKDATVFLVVSVRVPAQAKRINITIDEALLRRLDKKLDNIGESRSHFFTQAAKKVLN